MLSCPSICCTTRKSAPFSTRWVANECRKVWGEMFLVMPAIFICSFIIVKIITLESLPPLRLRNSVPSDSRLYWANSFPDRCVILLMVISAELSPGEIPPSKAISPEVMPSTVILFWPLSSSPDTPLFTGCLWLECFPLVPFVADAVSTAVLNSQLPTR